MIRCGCLMELTEITCGRFIECTVSATNIPISFSGFAIFVQVQRQWVHIIIKPKGAHCIQNIFSVDGFSFLILATFTRFRRNK